MNIQVKRREEKDEPIPGMRRRERQKIKWKIEIWKVWFLVMYTPNSPALG